MKKERKIRCGIYIVKNSIDDRVYIGQAIDIRKRLQSHFTKLKNDHHDNRHLQNFYNKYGQNSLYYYVLKECPEEKLKQLEIAYIKLFDSFYKGFNQTLGGDLTALLREKEFHLKNYITGEEVRGKGIGAFARKYNLHGDTVRFLVRGKMNYVGGWYDPKRTEPRPKRVLISPDGIKYEFYNMREFCREHKLNFSSVHSLFNEEKNVCSPYRGWRREDVEYTGRIYPSNPFALRNPQGEIINGVNLKKFARDNKLSQGCLWNVLNDKIRQYKGWTKV